MTGESKPAVAFLGLGIMGQAMAANLLKSGLFNSVIVWNRSPAKTADLVAAGAVAAATPAAAVEGADIVFGMLADPKAALDVSRGLPDHQITCSDLICADQPLMRLKLGVRAARAACLQLQRARASYFYPQARFA